MTLGELNKFIISELTASLGESEARATARLLIEDDLGITPTTLVAHSDRLLEPETEIRFRKFVKNILAGIPPQYVVGRARFMGLNLKVTEATLIPRPETAELVDIVIDYAAGRKDLHIADIGTGSGCIAISLARALPFAELTAFDISADALNVARDNCAALAPQVKLKQADILIQDIGTYDIIVSNPPYIAEHERASMEARVVEHEPASALFVPDSDPLKFYRAIIENSHSDAYFFEINPLFKKELTKMLTSSGFDVDIRRDSFGLERFAVATR